MARFQAKCFGGPKDGEFIAQERDRFEVAIMRKVSVMDYEPFGTSEHPPEPLIALYTFERINLFGEIHNVWIYRGLPNSGDPYWGPLEGTPGYRAMIHALRGVVVR